MNEATKNIELYGRYEIDLEDLNHIYVLLKEYIGDGYYENYMVHMNLLDSLSAHIYDHPDHERFKEIDVEDEDE